MDIQFPIYVTARQNSKRLRHKHLIPIAGELDTFQVMHHRLKGHEVWLLAEGSGWYQDILKARNYVWSAPPVAENDVLRRILYATDGMHNNDVMAYVCGDSPLVDLQFIGDLANKLDGKDYVYNIAPSGTRVLVCKRGAALRWYEHVCAQHEHAFLGLAEDFRCEFLRVRQPYAFRAKLCLDDESSVEMFRQIFRENSVDTPFYELLCYAAQHFGHPADMRPRESTRLDLFDSIAGEDPA